MDRNTIKKEANKNRKNAEEYFAEWMNCRAQILEWKAIKCLEIAEALELALDYNADEEKMKSLEEKIRRIEKEVEMCLASPDDERTTILNRLLVEVRR